MKKNIVLNVEAKTRKRNLPRTAFQTGNEHAFKPGICPNPTGRRGMASEHRLISKALHVQLANRAPNAIAEGVGLAIGSSWAQCVAAALLHTASRGDVQAAREIRDAVGDVTGKAEWGAGANEETSQEVIVQFVSRDSVARPEVTSATLQGKLDESQSAT